MYVAAAFTFVAVLLYQNGNTASPVAPPPPPVAISPAIQEWLGKTATAEKAMRTCKFYVVSDIQVFEHPICQIPLSMYESLSVQSKALAKNATDEELDLMLEVGKRIRSDVEFINNVLDIDEKLYELDKKEFPGEVK